MMKFGQVVIGPPGSGKTTYCNAMHSFLSQIGRKVAIVNLDPANDNMPYKPAIDLSELISISDAMDNLHLGPNGGLIYCMEYLETNIDWFQTELEKIKDCYILFDCPGQVELYTHHNSLKNIFEKLLKWDYRLVAMHLVDSHYCSDPSKFIAVLLTTLSTMLQISLPQVNVLSKADLIESYGKLAFNLDFYTDVMDLSFLLDHLQDDPFFKKFKKMNQAICGVIEDYSLVSFTAMDIQNKETVLRVVKLADGANGYIFGDTEERNIASLMSCAVQAEFQYEKLMNIQEKYMNDDDDKIDNSEAIDN